LPGGRLRVAIVVQAPPVVPMTLLVEVFTMVSVVLAVGVLDAAKAIPPLKSPVVAAMPTKAMRESFMGFFSFTG
jgi:hypothetical protein